MILFSIASGSGQHWFIVFKPTARCIEVFDSLGSNENYIKDKIPPYAKNVVTNVSAVQPINSTMCGEFCCFFIIHRMLNLDLSFFECCNAIFKNDNKINEKNVTFFLNNDSVSDE